MGKGKGKGRGKGRGLLVKGTPLAWEDALSHLKYVRDHGVRQFIATYNRVKGIKNDNLLWGEEVEYTIIRLDHELKTTKLSLRAKELEDSLNAKEDEFLANGGRPTDGCTWLPEYGSWMIEATPKVPYTGFTTDLQRVEENLRLRRARLLCALDEHEIAPTICSFPMLGVGDFTYPAHAPGGSNAVSKWVPDACTNPHPRFGTLTQNIRKRRGSKVDIRIPLFIDKHTFGSRSKRRKEMVLAIGHGNPGMVQGHDAQGDAQEEDEEEDEDEDDEEGSKHGTPRGDRRRRASSVGSAAGAGSSAAAGKGKGRRPSLERLTSEAAGMAPGGALGVGKSPSAQADSSKFDLFLSADDEIVMDCMAFGMGCCCLQVTFQARDVDESRRLFDLLAPMAPIMLALTAATPIFKGQLADTDVRWNVIGASVDCRTPQERGQHCEADEEDLAKAEMAGGGRRRLRKSRYASVSNYIWGGGGKDAASGAGAAAAGADTTGDAAWREDLRTTPHVDVASYNDIDAPIDEEAYKTLIDGGVDELLSRHIAHLFTRDPLVIYSERIELDDTTETDHFENIQSTNWQTLRWKPPPPPSEKAPHVGWRTEFRSMELQLTDFENAAFAVFVVLVSRVILAFDLNTYIPMSQVDDNMATAHRRDAARTERFWFRRHLVDPEGGVPKYEDESEKMTIQQILMGKGTYFPGLIPMIFAYLDSRGCDAQTRKTLSRYLKFIRKRATGEVMTTASWIRKFVTEHEDYQQDSVVTQRISYDLMRECHQIGAGLKGAPELVGASVAFRPVDTRDPYPVELSGATMKKADRDRLIKMYLGRSSFVGKKRKRSSLTPTTDKKSSDGAGGGSSTGK